MAGLEALPSDLIPAILRWSTCKDLAKLALTNAEWAARVSAVLFNLWTEWAEAERRWTTAKSIADVKALLLDFETLQLVRHLYGSRNEIDIEDLGPVVCDADAFSALKQELKAHNPPSRDLRNLLKVKSTNEKARFKWAKSNLYMMDTRWEEARRSYDRFGIHSFEALVVAVTIRLAPPALHELVCGLLAVPNLHLLAYQDGAILDFLASALSHNINCASWSAASLFELMNAVKAGLSQFEATDPPLTDSVIMKYMRGEECQVRRCSSKPGTAAFTFEDTFYAAQRMFKPPTDSDNQDFWFEFTSCYFAEGWHLAFDPEMCNTSALAKHAARLSVAVLTDLLSVIASWEDNYWEMMDHSEFHDSDEEAEGERKKFWVAALNGWAKANLIANANVDEVSAFALMIAAQDEYVKRQLLVSRKAMDWVASAAEAGDMDTVLRIANALK